MAVYRVTEVPARSSSVIVDKTLNELSSQFIYNAQVLPFLPLNAGFAPGMLAPMRLGFKCLTQFFSFRRSDHKVGEHECCSS